MAQRIQPEGTCAFCRETMTKRKLANHLKKCAGRQEAIAAAEKTAAASQALFQLQVKTPYRSPYWLDLEINGSAELWNLDQYLRTIWLECCDHLSDFSTGKSWREELEGYSLIEDIFARQTVINYEFDYGSTTKLVIEKIGVREGTPVSKHPIRLLSRNVMPKEKCLKCGKEAEYLCTECFYESESVGYFCKNHADKHEHEEYLSFYVNSPRTGVCGYDGPAEPPY